MLKQCSTTFIVTAILAGFALGCATSPTGRKQFITQSDGQVDQMGVSAFDEMKQKLPISKDAKLTAYVRCVAGEITAVYPEKQEWEVVLFENPEANAFALPGGKIGVYTGILKIMTDPAQLAAVLGHEVGHVWARHSNERLSEQGLVAMAGAIPAAIFKDPNSKTYQLSMAALGAGAQFGFVLPHSRTQESEADTIGLDLMAKAGFDPHQAVELWKNMAKAGGAQPPQFMSTHPSNTTRIQALESKMGGAEATFGQTTHRPSCHR
ncbi:M48 family metallopeptidase [soil metagenome]